MALFTDTGSAAQGRCEVGRASMRLRVGGRSHLVGVDVAEDCKGRNNEIVNRRCIGVGVARGCESGS
jgi:hypothetical protein